MNSIVSSCKSNLVSSRSKKLLIQTFYFFPFDLVFILVDPVFSLANISMVGTVGSLAVIRLILTPKAILISAVCFLSCCLTCSNKKESVLYFLCVNEIRMYLVKYTNRQSENCTQLSLTAYHELYVKTTLTDLLFQTVSWDYETHSISYVDETLPFLKKT